MSSPSPPFSMSSESIVIQAFVYGQYVIQSKSNIKLLLTFDYQSQQRRLEIDLRYPLPSAARGENELIQGIMEYVLEEIVFYARHSRGDWACKYCEGPAKTTAVYYVPFSFRTRQKLAIYVCCLSLLHSRALTQR